MLQRKVFINKIRILQRTKTLQRTRKNVIGGRSTRVRMKYRAFPLWLERQSSFLLSFVRFSYQFSSVICLFAPCLCFSNLHVQFIKVHHHHHHHISVMEFGHLLTRSGLTYPEVSSMVYHNSFCQLDNSVSLPCVIYYEAFCLHVVSNYFINQL